MGILTEDMKCVVREQALGFVATVCADGTPNLSPKGTTAVLDDDHLVFLDIRSPGTVENLLRFPAVEINVVDPIVRKGYRFKGTATILAEGPEFDDALSRFAAERPEVRTEGGRAKHVVVVRVEQALPLVSPAYDAGAGEAEVAARWEEHHDRLRRAREARTSD